MGDEEALPAVHAKSTIKMADLMMGRAVGRAATFMIHRRLCVPDVSAAFLVHGKWGRDAADFAAWIVAHHEAHRVLPGSEFERVAVGESFGA